MCFFYTAPKWERIKSYYRVAAPEDTHIIRDYEDSSIYMKGYEQPEGIIITNENTDRASIGKWGLVPDFVFEDPAAFVKRYFTVNAKIETAGTLKTYKKFTNNRCLIPAEAFTEWRWDEPGNSKCKKQEYLIKPKGREIFSFAGLYNVWNGKAYYTILTTDANDLMADIHNNKLRMPVVLQQEDELPWLMGTQLEKFALPYQVELEAEPVKL